MNQSVDNAIGGYEDGHLVNAGKNIHSDDAQEAYNKWNNSMLGCEDGHTAFMAGWCISRKAMQDAFEQVCVALEKIKTHAAATNNLIERKCKTYEICQNTLSAAAPFRKGARV